MQRDQSFLTPAATILVATRNPHKLAEIQSILGDSFRYLSLNDFPGAPAVVEDEATFAGNASKKAAELARWMQSGSRSADSQLTIHPPRAGQNSADSPIVSGKSSGSEEGARWFVLADDSGLEVDTLGGAPGVHSARFASLDDSGGGPATAQTAGGNSTDEENNAKLLRRLRDVPLEKRRARFRCVLAVVRLFPRPALRTPHLCEGVCEGRIGFAATGQGGFGYDPLFIPEGCTQTFGELDEVAKNRISHRARALERLRDWLSREK